MSIDQPIRILLIDAHSLARTGLRLLLDAEADFRVIGAVASGEAALAFLAEAATPVHIVLTELALPGLDGLALIRQVRALPSPPRCLLMTLHADDAALRSLVENAADGCILKDAAVGELLAAIRAVARGEVALSPRIAGRLMAFARGGGDGTAPRDGATLTAREREILDLLAQGLTSKAIARILGLSTNTVVNYRARLLEKLGVHNTAAAICRASEQGLLATAVA